MVPAIVLVISVIGFGLIAGDRFFHPFNLSLIIQQVSVIGISGRGAEPDHPDRGHRPLGRARSWCCARW